MQSPLGIAHTPAQVKLGSEVALARSAGDNALTGGTSIACSTTVSKSKLGGKGIRLDGNTTSACIAVQTCLLLPTFPSCSAIFFYEQVPSRIPNTVGQLDPPPPVTDACLLSCLPDHPLTCSVLGACRLALSQGEGAVVWVWRKRLTSFSFVAIRPSVVLPSS